MRRTLKLKLSICHGDRDAIVRTIEKFNIAASYCAEWGYENHTSAKRKVHDATYYKVREKFGLPASLATSARDVACEALRAVKLKKLPKFRLYGAIRYNKRVISVNLDRKDASIATIGGRVKASFVMPEYYKKYLDWQIRSSTLSYTNGRFFIHVTVEKEAPEPIDGPVLGIDSGIVNLAVCSDNIFFNSKKVKNARAKYAYLRRRLQAKGTRSAKRKLKRISRREKRFMADVNHCITKEIVHTNHAVFVLEDLKHIRIQKRKGKRFDRKLNNWAFLQFEQFLMYKAEAFGKQIVFVDPKHTSQKCSKCGHIYKGNRNGPVFRCRECGFQLHADLNASRNIARAGISCLCRPSVNRPIVAGNDEHPVPTPVTSPSL